MTEDKPLNERDIQRRLMWRYCANVDIRMVNYTPRFWWECDLIRITPAGYWYEYEVKLTVSDFKRDADKHQVVWFESAPGLYNRTNNIEYKHDLLAANEGRGPKQFWFVMPTDLMKIDEVPSWAGVIWASRGTGGRVQVNPQRQAPNRKTEKMTADDIIRLKESAYHRYVNQIWEG